MTRNLNIVDYQRQFLRRVLFWLIIVTGIFLIWYSLSGIDSFLDEEVIYVPVSINALEVADYKLNAPGMVNSVNLSIIPEVIQDQNISLGVSTVVVPEITLTVTNVSEVITSPNAPTSTPLVTVAVTANTPIPVSTSVANPTLGLPPILPTLEPIVSTVVAPVITILPPIVPTVVQIIPTLLPDLPLPIIPSLFP